jgi:hypothetical protein
VLCHCVWSQNLKNEKAKTRKWVVKASKRRRRRSTVLYLTGLSFVTFLHIPVQCSSLIYQRSCILSQASCTISIIRARKRYILSIAMSDLEAELLILWCIEMKPACIRTQIFHRPRSAAGPVSDQRSKILQPCQAVRVLTFCPTQLAILLVGKQAELKKCMADKTFTAIYWRNVVLFTCIKPQVTEWDGS